MSDTGPIQMDINKKDIDILNGWNQAEQTKGRSPNQPMKQHYAQIELLIAPFKRYTKAM